MHRFRAKSLLIVAKIRNKIFIAIIKTKKIYIRTSTYF